MIKKVLICIIICLSLIIISYSYNIFSSNNIKEEKVPEMFALFIEQGDGSYLPSEDSTWPQDYLFSNSKSYCKAGSILSWNTENNSVSIASAGADECYVYFDLPPDINIARLTLDNNPITAYPVNDGTKSVDITCTNATGKWNYDEWLFEIDDIEGKPNCSVDFTTIINPKTMANYIIEDVYAGTEGNNGMYYTNDAEYRYTGVNPNNYIWFNDEMWRIIGVFNEASHGQTGQNLVKIIREESFTFAFDTRSDSSWAETSGGKATLNELYNNYYYNGTDGTSYEGCRIHNTTLTTNCNFIEKGLDLEARNMTQEVVWYLGSRSTTTSASTFYNNERGSSVSSGTALTTTENIGLIYPSDYGYASPQNCWSTNLGSYSTAACGGSNWILTNATEWTISSQSSETDVVFRVYYNGNLDYYNANFGSASRPVLYLKSSVEYLDGTGSENNPFIIKL